MADAVSMAIAVYKNGSLLLQTAASSSGTGGGGSQGPWITVEVPVTAATDYFEIWVEQSSGGNRDINGANTATWVTARMVSS